MSPTTPISGGMLPLTETPVREQGRAATGKRLAGLEQACKDFEALFINQMMQEMRKTVPQDGLINGGQAEQIYTGMLDAELSRSISNQRSMGLSSMLYRQLAGLMSAGESDDPK